MFGKIEKKTRKKSALSINVTISLVFHTEATVSIGLKNVLRVGVLTSKHLNNNNNNKMKLFNSLPTFIWDNKEG